MRKPAGIDPMVKTELFSDFVDKMHLKPSAKRPATDDEDDCDGNPSKYAELNEWKRKKRFFDANQDKFEPWLNDMYNDAKNKPSGSRAAVRHIVEQAVETTNDGKLKLCIQNPFLRNMQQNIMTNMARQLRPVPPTLAMTTVQNSKTMRKVKSPNPEISADGDWSVPSAEGVFCIGGSGASCYQFAWVRKNEKSEALNS